MLSSELLFLRTILGLTLPMYVTLKAGLLVISSCAKFLKVFITLIVFEDFLLVGTLIGLIEVFIFIYIM